MVLAFISRVLYGVVIVKHRFSNYKGTLFFLITSEPSPNVRSVISAMFMNLGI